MSLLEYSFPFLLIAHSHSLAAGATAAASIACLEPVKRISYYTITDYIHMFTLVSERICVFPFLLLWRDLFFFFLLLVRAIRNPVPGLKSNVAAHETYIQLRCRLFTA